MQQLITPIQKITIFAIAIAILWIPYPITPSAFSDATFQRVAAQETDAASDRLLKAQKSNELGRVAMSSFREGKYKAAFKNCSELWGILEVPYTPGAGKAPSGGPGS